eukprot:4129661-Pleurochrysis_carterae.AAC.1
MVIPLHWYKKAKELFAYGFTQSEYDHCLFYLTKGTDRLIVLLYVDGIITAHRRGTSLRSDRAEHFSSKFSWTDSGTDLQEFVSIRLRQTPGVVRLDSERYITELASEIFPGG